MIFQAIIAIVWRRLTVRKERWESEPEFCLKIAKCVEDGFLCLQLSLGIQLGLFNTLESHNETPWSSHEIAQQLNFKERYR